MFCKYFFFRKIKQYFSAINQKVLFILFSLTWNHYIHARSSSTDVDNTPYNGHCTWYHCDSKLRTNCTDNRPHYPPHNFSYPNPPMENPPPPIIYHENVLLVRNVSNLCVENIVKEKKTTIRTVEF